MPLQYSAVVNYRNNKSMKKYNNFKYSRRNALVRCPTCSIVMKLQNFWKHSKNDHGINHMIECFSCMGKYSWRKNFKSFNGDHLLNCLKELLDSERRNNCVTSNVFLKTEEGNAPHSNVQVENLVEMNSVTDEQQVSNQPETKAIYAPDDSAVDTLIEMSDSNQPITEVGPAVSEMVLDHAVEISDVAGSTVKCRSQSITTNDALENIKQVINIIKFQKQKEKSVLKREAAVKIKKSANKHLLEAQKLKEQVEKLKLDARMRENEAEQHEREAIEKKLAARILLEEAQHLQNQVSIIHEEAQLQIQNAQMDEENAIRDEKELLKQYFKEESLMTVTNLKRYFVSN